MRTVEGNAVYGKYVNIIVRRFIIIKLLTGVAIYYDIDKLTE